MPHAVMASTPSAQEREWRAEEDQRTLMRAAEIMADRARMKGVLRAHSKQRKSMATLESILASRRLQTKEE